MILLRMNLFVKLNHKLNIKVKKYRFLFSVCFLILLQVFNKLIILLMNFIMITVMLFSFTSENQKIISKVMINKTKMKIKMKKIKMMMKKRWKQLSNQKRKEKMSLTKKKLLCKNLNVSSNDLAIFIILKNIII